MAKATAKKTSNVELVKFEMNLLKHASIQVAVESTALSILSLLVFIGAPSVFPEVINPYDPNSLKILQGVIILPFAYWLLAVIGNMVRLRRIQKLQKQLQ